MFASAGIADGQHPDEMALPASTDGATGAMTDVAAEQGATKDFRSGEEGVSEFGARLLIASFASSITMKQPKPSFRQSLPEHLFPKLFCIM